MAHEATMERTVFLSTLPVSSREKRSAWLVVALLLALFLLAAPFAKVKLPEVWAFIPSYQSALLINDLITAILLLAQFAIIGSLALLVLAGGYLFAALMVVSHTLSFPRLFAPEGLLGAGPQTTAWLYMIWHAGFPIAVMAYTLVSDGERVRRRGLAILITCVVVLGAAGAATLLTTIGHGLLPPVMLGNTYTANLPVVIGTVWLLSLLALIMLWRRSHSVLDVWLMVVMTAWLCDIGLSAVLNAGRFDLGFYAGRTYGLMAATLVLLVLLIETSAAYARTARSFEAERALRNRQLTELQTELIHVSRLTELGQMVSALAHEVNQPLTAAASYVRAARRLLHATDIGRTDEALQKANDQVTRASQVIQRLRQFVRKAEAQRGREDIREVVEDSAALALLGAEGRVRLQLDLSSDTPLVFVDRVQIQQVLVNLIRNAVEAMQGAPHRELLIRTGTTTDGMVEVSVADTGPGLAPDVREKLFQPFVTTKAAGMGVACRSATASSRRMAGGCGWPIVRRARISTSPCRRRRGTLCHDH
jgi:signal transduction histidine kinase